MRIYKNVYLLLILSYGCQNTSFLESEYKADYLNSNLRKITSYNQPKEAFEYGQHGPEILFDHYYPDGKIYKQSLMARPNGKKLLIAVGNSHCPHFRGSLPYLDKFRKDNPDVEIKIAVSEFNSAGIEEAYDLINEYKKIYSFTWIASAGYSENSIGIALNYSASITYFLFDSNGKYIKQLWYGAHPMFIKHIEQIFRSSI